MTHSQLMEGCNFNLPFNDQILYRLWSKRTTWKSSGSARMLYCHVRDGWSPANNVHRRTTTIAELVEELEEVTLDDSRPEQTTRMGTLASWLVHQVLMTFLRDNQDVFAWSHEDMSGIAPSIIVHRLNVSPPFSPIR